jgi:hypothetical protein
MVTMEDSVSKIETVIHDKHTKNYKEQYQNSMFKYFT